MKKIVVFAASIAMVCILAGWGEVGRDSKGDIFPGVAPEYTKTTTVNIGTKYKGVFTATGYGSIEWKAYDSDPAAALVKVWFNNYTGASHSYYIANSGTYYMPKGLTSIKFGAYSTAKAKTVYIIGH